MKSVWSRAHQVLTLKRVAAGAAVMQLIFAGLEIFGWGPWFVTTAAPSWLGMEFENPSTEMLKHIDWARQLAANMGVYNLVFALGLAWVAFDDERAGDRLASFLGAGLVVVAIAAFTTGVYGACVLQGATGLLLLWTTYPSWTRLAFAR